MIFRYVSRGFRDFLFMPISEFRTRVRVFYSLYIYFCLAVSCGGRERGTSYCKNFLSFLPGAWVLVVGLLTVVDHRRPGWFFLFLRVVTRRQGNGFISKL